MQANTGEHKVMTILHNVLRSMQTKISGFCTNPLSQSMVQVKLDSNKWKSGKNLLESIENFSKFDFRASKN